MLPPPRHRYVTVTESVMGLLVSGETASGWIARPDFSMAWLADRPLTLGTTRQRTFWHRPARPVSLRLVRFAE